MCVSVWWSKQLDIGPQGTEAFVSVVPAAAEETKVYTGMNLYARVHQ